MKKSSFIILLVIASLLYGCGLRTSGSGGRIKKYAESYYRGDGKTLFFIKPITFKGDKNKLKADFTFNKGDSTKEYVIVNIDIYGTPPFNLSDSISFFFGENSFTDDGIKLIFNENLSRKPFSRQSTKLPVEDFKAFIKADEVTIATYDNGKKDSYSSGKRWDKIHDQLYKMMFW